MLPAFGRPATFLLFVVVVAVGSLCAHADENLEFFEKRIRPLLDQHCYECHSQASGVAEGQLLLDGRDALLRGGNRGPAVVPGKPEASLLIEALRYGNGDLQMPPPGKLSEAEIELFAEWVRRGAAAPESSGAKSPAPGEIDWNKAQQFWAFQPLREVAAPATEQGWVRRRIDPFVFARLQQAGLAPRAEADRRTLIRRVTFDLAGLPPTPQEIQDFLADKSPDAYERLVDRLLARPEYGERWARFWLDLARYTDQTPDFLLSAENAWLYRDWVIRAFNEDLPFDQFGKRQLAADFLEDSAPEDIAALGFLGLNPTHWKELRLAPVLIEQVVAEEWDEQIDAVGRTFLGLTVSCARCHDHKFDPITMRDYYGLAGVFASSRQAPRPLLEGPAAQEALAIRGQLDELEQKLKTLTDQKSPDAETLRQQIAELKAAHPVLNEPWAHAVVEASVFVLPDGEDQTKVEYRRGEVRDLPIFLRGNPASQGEVVPRRFLRVFSAGDPQPFTQGSGRAELAAALFAESGPLAARVFVNRVWHQLFGEGLVRTPSDFGSQGEPPTHPELLEDLAARFVHSGWSVKWLQRELVLSAAYRQSSAADERGQQLDPENRLLWRMNRKRLDVECWRDTMLSAAGTLDRRMYGPASPLDQPEHRRRTLYGLIGRHEMNTMLRLFDVPEPSAHSPARQLTTTPLQQLFVLNGPLMVAQSSALVQRVFTELPAAPVAERVQRCYGLLLGRAADTEEVASAERFLQQAMDVVGMDEREAWRHYAHALLGLNEMLFID